MSGALKLGAAVAAGAMGSKYYQEAASSPNPGLAATMLQALLNREGSSLSPDVSSGVLGADDDD